ncbi:hypothetical protein GQ44DRAFT_733494 [Phaeosphaeriaceae sp. PMI808]|nr:hypothetical protein GQ44DRAFT_733494 [Phaeosphaeriaceae sp. PMI808]
MCVTNSSNLVLDTGYLDSDNHLGLNEGPRFLVRYIQHCAPLVTSGFSKLNKGSESPPLQYMQYYYGNSSNNTEDPFTLQVQVNVSQPNHASNPEYFYTRTVDYKLSAIYSNPNDRTHFTPIPQLDRSDAQVSLLFLDASDVINRNKTEDPWFAATTRGPYDGIKVYVADEPSGVLGCATQRFWCNPQLPEDTRCINFFEAGGMDHLSKLWADPVDRAIVRGAMAPLNNKQSSLLEAFYRIPGLPSLLSRVTLIGPFQLDEIPSNRWQSEIEYTFQAGLAATQSMLVEAARGGFFWGLLDCTGEDGVCIRKCKNQKIKSSRYYSFSVLGLSVILFVGGFIMILGLFIESVAGCMGRLRRRKGSRSAYTRLEWQANSTLQLQRLAHEPLGFGTWSRTMENVPVTAAGELLGVFNIADKRHPRLVRPERMDMFTDIARKGRKSTKYTQVPASDMEEVLPLRSESDTNRRRRYTQ